MTKRFSGILAAFCVLAILPEIGGGANARRPNILVILCDDLGYSDVGFNGATDIHTPSLDALAKHGTICTSGYVPHPFCGPSRMGLMSGRYPHTFGAPFNLPPIALGIEEYNRQGIPVSETLISTMLQKAGYHTGAIGKWHMGITQPFHLNRRGFDDFYGFLGGGHMYFPEKYQGIYDRQTRAGKQNINEYVLPLEHNGTEVRETEYLTDALSREAVRFVSKASAQNNPFFLYLAYNAPHTPLEAKEEDLKKYANIKDENRRTYAAMVHAVDRGVGQIVAALKDAGEYEDTLIVFSSDNGGKLSAGATNRPLREGKGSTYEGGYRVPMFFHWPGHVPAGRRFDHPVSSLDFYPTFANLADAAIPVGKRLDGKDIWSDFLGGRNPHPGQMIFAVRHRQGYSDVGARRDGWKVCRVGNGPWQLFDLTSDPGERHSVSSQHPELVQALVGEAERWSRTHTQPRWFDDREAEAAWKEAEMPRYDETFSFKTESPTANTQIAPTATKSKGDSTLAEFIEKDRIKWQAHGWKWNRKNVETVFDEIDANDDGVASGREKKTYWEKRRTAEER